MTLALENVSKVVGAETYIDDVSLELAEGSFNVLLGLTLAGKTTLMRLMAGLDRPTHGRVLVDGRDVTGVSVRKRNVAMVYQQFINYPSLTCYENIASPLRLAGSPRPRSTGACARKPGGCISSTCSTGLPAELSGGQQQRVALARALVKEAPFLFLDEPLANLDYKLREEMREEMRQMFGRRPDHCRLRHDRAPGGAVARRQYGCHRQGTPAPVRPCAGGLSPPGVDDGERNLQRPADQSGARVDRPRWLPAVAGSRLSPPAAHARAGAGRLSGRRAGQPHRPRAAPCTAPSPIPVAVELAEISGSETYIHARHARHDDGCACVEGVHGYGLGETIRFYLDPNRLFVFDERRQARGRARRRRRRPEGPLMAQIEFKGVAHSYRRSPANPEDYALQPMDMTWEDGGAYALLGPSGSGKTTLLNITSGLLFPSEGQVLFDGVDATRLPTAQRNIAQVFQFPVIYDTMTVFDNFAFPLRNRKVKEPEVRRRVVQVAEMLGLADVLNKRASGLAADAKQKISLGRGLVRSDVAAILFDEPLTVIDPHSKWSLRRKLKQIHQEFKLTLIYVTHDQAEALTFADQVVVLHEGRVVQVGSPTDLFERPAHTFVGHFIGSPGMNIIPCEIDGAARASTAA